MEFIKTLWKNRKLVLKLGKSDFKNRFASTSLGSIWGFLQPFVFMMMYVIVFQFIFKVGVLDIDDLILCTLGMMIFYVCYYLKNKEINNEK